MKIDIACLIFLGLFSLKGFWAADRRGLSLWFVWILCAAGVSYVLPLITPEGPHKALFMVTFGLTLVVITFPAFYTVIHLICELVELTPRITFPRRILGASFAFVRAGLILVLFVNFISILPLKSSAVEGSVFIKTLSIPEFMNDGP
ncbi:MAG: hypothetical protein HQL31_09120 [Planctomycetes bacterium]|nr:hypothetical protein [Planctomycetota bacterium]